MKEELVKVLILVLKDLGVTDAVPEVTIPENPENGEYTTNIAMRLASNSQLTTHPSASASPHLPAMLRKAQQAGAMRAGNPQLRSPMDIALRVMKKFTVYSSQFTEKQVHSTNQKDQTDTADLPQKSHFDVLQDIKDIKIAPPGFINFYLTDAKLGTHLTELLKQEEGGGTRRVDSGQWTVDSSKQKKRVMVEYTDPNPFKEFHIGHLYSNAVGESLARLHEATGWQVKRADYFGDVGMHVAKSIWGMRKQLSVVSLQLSDIEKKSLPERVKWMGQCYAAGSLAYEKDQGAKEEIHHLNKLIFIVASPSVDYQKGEPIDAHELGVVRVLFENGRQWSLDYFETIYQRLGTKFDYYYPESEVGGYGAKLVLEHIGKVFEESDGAVVYRGEKKGLHTRVFLNKLGLPTYEAKELGLNWKKHQDFPADLSLIVTGNEINEYFKVLMAAMTEVIPEVAAKTKHLGHGMVRLPEGKMSSRTGRIVTGELLIDMVREKVNDYLLQSNSKYTKEEQSIICERAAIAAVKYSMLKVSLPSDITFDLEKSVSFDGDSGPYLLYTYARCRSVLRKENVIAIRQLAEKQSQWNEDERSLARLIYYFPEVVEEVAANFAPNTLCTYLFHLAQAFNLFYAKHAILGSDSRLALTEATSRVLKTGLNLLGIETLEQM